MPNDVKRSKRTRVVNATAAGTSAINGTGVDMQDFESVIFECCMGTLTAGQVTSLKAQGSADNVTFADIAGAVTANAADGDSNKMLVLEVYRPQQRYVRCVVNRATQNAVIDAVVAIQSGPKKLGTTNDAATTSSTVFSVGV